MSDPNQAFRFARRGVFFASVSCALALAASGCSSSDDGGGAVETDTGTTTDSAGTDTAKSDGGTDTAVPDGGTDSGTDGSTDAPVADGETSADAGPAPFGTKLASGDFAIQGITTDGYVIVVDNISDALKAYPIAGGAAQTIATSVDSVNIDGKVVFAWSGVASNIGSLTTWTAVGGAKSPSTKSFEGFYAANPDASTIVYTDAAVGSATNLVISAVDGTAKKTLSAVNITDECTLTTQFAGARYVASYCTAPTGAVATVSSFDATGTASTILSGALAFFSVDAAGTKVFTITTAGAGQVFPITGGTAVAIDTDVAYGVMRPDATGVVYRTSVGTPEVVALKKAAIDGTGVTTLLASGFGGFAGWSSDVSSVLYTTAQDPDTDLTDLRLVQTATAPGTPVNLNTATTSAPGFFGSDFTTDNSRVLFVTDVDADLLGTLKSSLVSGGTATTLGTGIYYDFAATGTKVVFTNNYVAGSGTDPDRTDLRVVDAAGTGTSTLLQASIETEFALTTAKDKIVYAYTAVEANQGLYIGAIP